MEMRIPKSNETLLYAVRRAGYNPAPQGDSFVRVLAAGGYPRFHLYVDEMQDMWVCKLHLDQKRPSYEGSHAHAGEYSGEIIENEAARISGILTSK